jgi:pyruvate,water dikinase
MNKAAYVATFEKANVSEVGNKFYQLSIINKLPDVDVPEAVCLKSSAFSISLPKDARQSIQDSLTMLQSNGGYRLNKIQKEIEKNLDKLIIPEKVKNELKQFALQISQNWKYKLIVRSSSCFEDGEDSSGAGIYESVPEVGTEQELLNAIIHCWKAAFSLAAISHRLRINEFKIEPLPGLIVQRFIKSDISGVTFSQNPLSRAKGVFVEYTNDGTDGIESGTGVSKSFMAVSKTSDEYISNNHDLGKELETKLITTALKFKKYFKRETEYEWAAVGSKLYVLQARPITTLSAEESEKFSKPSAKAFDLYIDSDNIDKYDISEIKSIYDHSITKRKAVRLFAVKNAIAINGSAVIIANQLGLKDIDLANHNILNRLSSPVLTIDLGPYLRSFYTVREEMNQTLQTLLGSSKEASVIIREFASGEFSAVSMVKGDKVIIEVCRGSLIGINRGFVETATFSVDVVTREVHQVSGTLKSNRYYGFDQETKAFAFLEGNNGLIEDTVPDATLILIAKFNVAVNEQVEKNILEWTIIQGKPVYIDNTPDTDESDVSYDRTATFISPGEIQGTILRVDDLKKLEYISSGPTLNISGHLPTIEANKEIQELIASVKGKRNIIIVSKFPYTALSVLVGKVAGFIFESGPILCHLAIISRENKTPVAIVPDALTLYNNGDKVEIKQ